MKTSKNADGRVHSQTDVRQSMAKLPAYMQWFLTWMTGKPFEGQKPNITRTNLSHLFTAYIFLLGGICISIAGFVSQFYFLLLIGWILTVSGARKLIPTINHYCVHGDLLPAKYRVKYNWLHPYIADFNSSILFLQDFESYKKEHLNHHKINVVASIVDPDMAFLWELGIKAGMSKKQLWRVFINNLINPFSKLHRLFIFSRLKTTFRKTTPFRACLQLLVVIALILIAGATSSTTVIIAVVFPLTYLYHIASLLQFCSEHLWLSDVDEKGRLITLNNHKGLVQRSKRLTNARFCGEATPDTTRMNLIMSAIAWIKWIIRMIFIHLLVRLFVLPGDLVVHDWHHRVGFGADWSNAFYARAEMVKLVKDTKSPLTEVWGLHNALDLVFDNLTRIPPINPELIEHDDETILGM